MDSLSPHKSPEAFLADVFGSKLVRDGKVVRRSLRDIERYFGREEFIEEVYRRGFRAIENAGQVVIFCNAEPVRILRPKAQLPREL
nr:N-(5'-phosphoribosyl)anthranilate isomerase [Roseibacterium persicicum]